MDIFWHELNAYKTEILNLQSKTSTVSFKEIENFTHYSLGISNRTNLIVIGLCSLVEAFLYELAVCEEDKDKNLFKIDDLKGNGIERLQTYLARTGKVDFGKFPSGVNLNKSSFYVTRSFTVMEG